MTPKQLSKKRQREEERTKFKHDRQPPLKENADDDDFVECVKNKRDESSKLVENKKQKGTHVKNKRKMVASYKGTCKPDVCDDYPKISCRTSPYCLLKSIDKMNERQKIAVSELGFSHLLDMKISEIPTKLGHWVVDNFDPRSSELALLNNSRLRIVEEDVFRVFGFPRGERLIIRTEKHDASNLLQEWHKFFDKNKVKSLSPKDVAEVMLKREDGDTWFKRHFIILLTASLIENTKTGYIFPHTIDCLGDIDRVCEWNWCEYLLRRLVSSKVIWEEDRNKAFIGPALFLLVFYVDRVRIQNETVQRNFPLVVNWDYKKLKLRQASEIEKGRFGTGSPEEPIEMTMCIDNQEIDAHNNMESMNLDDRGRSQDGPDASHVEINVTRYADIIISKVKKAAENILEILKLIEDAPTGISDDLTFRKSVETAHEVIVCGDNISSPSNATIDSQTATQIDDAFWAQPHVIETIQAIENAKMRRLEYVTKMDDRPSFSLGFTQIFEEGKSGVMHETPNHNAAATTNHGYKSQEKEEDNANHTNSGLEIEPTFEKRNCRDKSKIKKTGVFFSPFVKRAVNTSAKLSKTEKALGVYALHNLEAEENEDLFKFRDVVLKRNEIMTMEVGGTVSIAIIDIWSIIQNYNEEIRSERSPSRFFATTNPCLQAIVSPPNDWDTERCFKSFHEKLEEELTKFSQIGLEKIDLFFFPIYRGVHFFLICIDVCKGKIFVIDNTNNSSSEGNLGKYDNIPFKLRDMLSAYMIQKGLRTGVSKLKKANVIIEELAWVDTQPNNDCGIYVMRHMETFMSTPSGKWSCGLSRRSTKQMRVMRVRYCASILGWERNELRDENLSMSDLHYRKISKTPGMDIDNLLLE